jgi:hypothetical protein
MAFARDVNFWRRMRFSALIDRGVVDRPGWSAICASDRDGRKGTVIERRRPTETRNPGPTRVQAPGIAPPLRFIGSARVRTGHGGRRDPGSAVPSKAFRRIATAKTCGRPPGPTLQLRGATMLVGPRLASWTLK